MSKSFSLLAGLICVCLSVQAQAPVSLSYYLPDSVRYDPAIPVPASVIGHEVGEWHVTHDKLVSYMKAVAAANPSRIRLEVTGTTYEGRQQLLLIITSSANQARLNDIKQQRAAICDPARSASLNTDQMPAVIWMGYSIHGNEPSGSNASLLAAYYLAAAQGPAIDDLLQNTVILLDPSFNPDGLNRFATWVNQHKSRHLVSDPQSREFSEVWPGGRFNHYWFDLNRDWLPAVHVESRNRLKYFHEWRPNVLTDHHEMGSNSTFFFQPGVPSRVNPLTPARNQELTAAIGKYHARFLDGIGSLYYTKEGYDDFYYGKGSTFPDIHGGVGILFEQGSSRGHLQETANGLLSFPFTIRNQFVTTLSSLEATRQMRRELLNYQRDFYRQAAQEAAASAVKGYVFGDAASAYNSRELAEMLQRHQIRFSPLGRELMVDGQRFQPGSAYVVPVEQPQYRLIRTIFEKQLRFEDSLFYDVTSWTMPIAFGTPYAALNAVQLRDATSGSNASTREPSGGLRPTDYAWLIDWRDFRAPRMVYALQQAGVLTKVANNTATLSVNGQPVTFPRGTVVVPRQGQTLPVDSIVRMLDRLAAENQVRVTGVASGNVSAGSDLGSNKMTSLRTPQVAMLVGTGVSATDAGEIWHLLDQRLAIPHTHLDIASFGRADLARYNVLIMPSGNYSSLNKEKLKSWIQDGGVLIACEDAVEWCANNGISTLKFKKVAPAVDSTAIPAYADKEQIDGAQRMNGAIFRASADLTHPLCYGYTSPNIDLFKTNSVFMQVPGNPFAAPVRFKRDPLVSGFITKQNYDALQNSASVVAQTVGRGRVIHLADNPNFRAFWLGSMRLFVNAIFFGSGIDAGSARADEEE